MESFCRHVGHAGGSGGSERKRQDHTASFAAGRHSADSRRNQRADSLRIVYFDQNRELDPDISLRRALAPDSDSVIYQDRVIHVASWASKFLFDPRASEPACRKTIWRRASACFDRAADVTTRGCPAAG